MPRLRHSVLVRRFLLPFSLILWLGACHKWGSVDSPELALRIEAEKPPEKRQDLRVYTSEGGEPFIGQLLDLARDTVVVSDGKSRMAIPTSDISRIDERRNDTLATVVAVGAFAGLVAVGVAMVALCPPPDRCGWENWN